MSSYRENPIRSLAALKKKLATMDPDEGIRILGGFPQFATGAFLFVTKTEGKFTINIAERVRNEKTHKGIPGTKEKWLNPQSLEDAYRQIMRYAKRPLEAWAY